MDDVEAWDEAFDCRAYPDAEISYIVRWRRAGDKLNHFERWAVRITADRPRDDRLSYLRSILPDGLIGDHAMSHLERLPELAPSNPGPDHLIFRRAYGNRSALAEARARRIAELEGALRDLYEHGGQRAFNHDMRHAYRSAVHHWPKHRRRRPPTEAPLLRTRDDITGLVSKAMFSPQTEAVLMDHARRYRPGMMLLSISR